MQTEESQQADIARNVYVLGVTSLLNDTASEMAYWILPAKEKRTQGSIWVRFH